MAILRNVRIALMATTLALLAHPALAQPQPPAPAPATAVPPALNQPVAPATSDNARDVLLRVRPAVIQIKGFFGSNTAQAFHGTGFAVAEDGVFMTNYHVVAQQVQFPDKYRLEYRTAEGKTGNITVLAIDVRHDLRCGARDRLRARPAQAGAGGTGQGRARLFDRLSARRRPDHYRRRIQRQG